MYNTYDEAAANALVGGVLVVWLVWIIFCLAILAVTYVSLWKIYAKAGRPGWAALIPFYNNYVLFEMVFGNGWMFLLLLVPCVNFVISIMLLFKLATAFGKDAVYGIGLLFLPIIFLPILAFGDAQYVGN